MQVRELEEQLQVARCVRQQPSAEAMELEMGLQQLTEHIIQKQAQVVHTTCYV